MFDRRIKNAALYAFWLVWIVGTVYMLRTEPRPAPISVGLAVR